jgi:hypothetical protein
MKPFSLGDQVAYSIQFLKSIFEPPTSPMCHARGVIRKLVPLGQTTLAEVDWGADVLPSRVNTENLAIVGPNIKFCNID